MDFAYCTARKHMTVEISYVDCAQLIAPEESSLHIQRRFKLSFASAAPYLHLMRGRLLKKLVPMRSYLKSTYCCCLQAQRPWMLTATLPMHLYVQQNGARSQRLPTNRRCRGIKGRRMRVEPSLSSTFVICQGLAWGLKRAALTSLDRVKRCRPRHAALNVLSRTCS